jgi:hypothetical protein
MAAAQHLIAYLRGRWINSDGSEMTMSLFLAAFIFATGIPGEQPRASFSPTFFRSRILRGNDR